MNFESEKIKDAIRQVRIIMMTVAAGEDAHDPTRSLRRALTEAWSSAVTIDLIDLARYKMAIAYNLAWEMFDARINDDHLDDMVKVLAVLQPYDIQLARDVVEQAGRIGYGRAKIGGQNAPGQ